VSRSRALARSSARAWIAVGVAALAIAAARPAAGAGPREEASRAFAEGDAAERDGRLADAARKFGEADAILPNDEALAAALEVVLKTEERELGLDLARRAEARGTPALAELARRVRAKLAPAIAPPPDPPPVAPAATEPPAPAPAPPAPAPPQRDRAAARGEGVAPSRWGLPPAVTFVAAGAAVALGGVGVWSAVDTGGRHDDFERSGCRANIRLGDCASQAEAGRAAELRTNVLLGASGALAFGALAMGVFFTDWGAAKPRAGALFVAPSIDGRGAHGGVGGAF